ncbi:MAG: hypothetical protein HC819_09125 [Cyclobacteriaceae bacterium]|nr:hypothetical protein [Cyclobacteriaceae bacterium]
MGLFNVFNKDEKSRNRSYIKNLLDVASSDGHLDESERNLIISIAAKFDITKDEVQEILTNPNSIKFTPPSSYSAKVKLLEDLVKIMIADKKIDENEVRICKNLAVEFNIAPIIVDELIQANIK